MKKLFTTMFAVLLLAFMVTSVAQAQEETAPMSKGLKFGLNMAKVTGDSASMGTVDATFKPGFAFGGFLGFNLSPAVTIQPEVMYVMKGAKYEEGDMELQFKVNYLEVPVLLKYNFTTSGSISPALFVGPAVAFKIGAKAKISDQTYSEEVDLENIKSTDFGLIIGAGFDFAAENYNIVFDVRYTVGMSGLADTKEATFDDYSVLILPNEWDIKNSNLAFLVGIGF